MKVALVHHGRGTAAVHDIAAGLRGLGHEVALLEPDPLPIEPLLRRRGFSTPLTQIPFAVRALARGGYDVAHAFSPQDAYAALRWRRHSGRPVVLSLIGPIERERLADGRLRLRLLSAVLEESDAVIVHDEDTREAAWRWLALEPRLIAPGDGPALELLYRGLTDQT